MLQIGRHERQKHAVVAAAVGIDADQRMAVEIFHDVGDKPILPERYHNVAWPEDETGQKAPVDGLISSPSLEGLDRVALRRQIDIMLSLVVGEVRAQMLHIE